MSRSKRSGRTPVCPEPSYDGYRKDPAKVFAELQERGVEEVLRRIASAYHVTPLEICGFAGHRPVPAARLDVWDYLASDPPKGPGWSFTRIADTWDLAPTSVSKPLGILRRRRAKLARKESAP